MCWNDLGGVSNVGCNWEALSVFFQKEGMFSRGIEIFFSVREMVGQISLGSFERGKFTRDSKSTRGRHYNKNDERDELLDL